MADRITLANCTKAQLKPEIIGLHPATERRAMIFAAGALNNETLKPELGSMELSTFFDGMVAAGLLPENPYWAKYAREARR